MIQTLHAPAARRRSPGRRPKLAAPPAEGARAFLAHDPTPPEPVRPWASFGREVRASLTGPAAAIQELQRRRNTGGE